MLGNRLTILISLWMVCLSGTLSEFLVNVKTEAGNIVKQSIRENIADSSVRLEYEDWNLTKVTQLVDFQTYLNIFRIIFYGEVELGEPPAQILCFISHFAPTEFIDPDAVSKLRQKNQDAVRSSETQLEKKLLLANLSIDIEKSALISDHIDGLCKYAKGHIYTTEADLNMAAKVSGRDYDTMKSATQGLTSSALTNCSGTGLMTEQCTCYHQFNIDWFPCSLRYCKGVVGNRPTTYKCGIKTCSITYSYQFPVESKHRCWWN